MEKLPIAFITNVSSDVYYYILSSRSLLFWGECYVSVVLYLNLLRNIIQSPLYSATRNKK